MRKLPIKEYIGNKETFNRLIKDMARAMNSAENGYKQEKDWKIYFHDFKKVALEEVRNDVIGKIRKLNAKYEVRSVVN